MIKKACILVVFSLSFLFAYPVQVFSIPKSGSHIMLKLLHLMGQPYKLHHFSHFDKNKIYLFQQAITGSRFKKIIILRDLRDVIYSHVLWVGRPCGEKWGFHAYYYDDKETYKEYVKLKKHEKMPAFLRSFGDLSPEFGNFKRIIPENIKKAKEWLHDPSILVIRFEDLVGEKGGGSKEKQIQTIKNVAEFLETELSDERIEEICGRLWGRSPTFRKGTIGQWEEHFTEEDVRLFKEYLGQDLIDFGYEQDFNWGLDQVAQ